MSGWTLEQAVSLMSLLVPWSNSVIRVKFRSWMMKGRWVFQCVPLIITPNVRQKSSLWTMKALSLPIRKGGLIVCLFPHKGALDLSSECYKHQAHAPNLNSWSGGHDPSRGPEWSWYPQKSPDPLQRQGHICKPEIWHFFLWSLMFILLHGNLIRLHGKFHHCAKKN